MLEAVQTGRGERGDGMERKRRKARSDEAAAGRRSGAQTRALYKGKAWVVSLGQAIGMSG